MSNKGVRYEHDLADDIREATGEELVPLGAGYTSIHGSPMDLLVDDGEAVHVFELKDISGDAFTLNWEPDDYQKDDLYYLCKFCVNYPRPTYPYYGVRFNNRQIVVGKMYLENFPEGDEVIDDAVKLCPVESKYTRAGNLRIYKPSCDVWTCQDIDDAQAVLDAIGYTI